jgi:hypothetical protein
LSGLRSKSIDKNSNGATNQKFNQQQFMQLHMQQSTGQSLAKKESNTMDNNGG